MTVEMKQPRPWATTILLACVLAASSPFAARAGGPESAQRLRVLGQCGPGGPPCCWDCATRTVACSNGATCAPQPTEVLTGSLVFYLDDSYLNGPGDCLSDQKVVFRGRDSQGAAFTLKAPLDYCGLRSCSDFGNTGFCSEPGASPSVNPFMCVASGAGLLTESAGIDMLGGWLVWSTLPRELDEALRARFPSAVGRPIIVSATRRDLVDNSNDPAKPSRVRLCVKIHFVPFQQGGACGG